MGDCFVIFNVGYWLMDLVYICKSGSNEELRYSIRSAVKNLKFDNLWVVGGKPDWYIGNYIEVPQKHGKYENLKHNAAAIVQSKEISDTFVLMNDDFYIIEQIDALHNFSGGRLIDKANLYDRLATNSRYTKRLFDTYEKLRKMGIENPIDFELHVPMIINKSGFRHGVKYDLLWRSMYGNIYEIESQHMEEDVKVYVNSNLNPKSYNISNLKYPYLSSEDKSFMKVYKTVLKNMFKSKSPYEA